MISNLPKPETNEKLYKAFDVADITKIRTLEHTRQLAMSDLYSMGDSLTLWLNTS